MSERYCRACGGWHDLEQPWPAKCFKPVEVARSGLAFPMVVTDTMPPLEHVDGKFYDSKRAFRAVTRREGYVEIGNEKLKPFQRKAPDREAIRASLRRAKAALS